MTNISLDDSGQTALCYALNGAGSRYYADHNQRRKINTIDRLRKTVSENLLFKLIIAIITHLHKNLYNYFYKIVWQKYNLYNY